MEFIRKYVEDHPGEFFFTADGRIGAYGTAYAPEAEDRS
jgi:hypothetical protein